MNVNKWILSICASIVIVLVQVIVTQWSWIEHLKRMAELEVQARNIQNEQVQDLVIQLNSSRYKMNTLGSQQFISGIMAAIQNPDYYNEVWHAGYNRGVDVQSQISSLDREQAYTKEEAR